VIGGDRSVSGRERERERESGNSEKPNTAYKDQCPSVGFVWVLMEGSKRERERERVCIYVIAPTNNIGAG
jgi:hypothetical protein